MIKIGMFVFYINNVIQKKEIVDEDGHNRTRVDPSHCSITFGNRGKYCNIDGTDKGVQVICIMGRGICNGNRLYFGTRSVFTL
jgi:hypothetical protein